MFFESVNEVLEPNKIETVDPGTKTSCEVLSSVTFEDIGRQCKEPLESQKKLSP